MRGIGCDIVEIARIKGVLERHADSFLKKTFSQNEQSYCLAMKEPSHHLAGRFAAKEAIAKALGTGFGKELSFLDIDITHDPQGRPTATLSPNAAIHFNHPTIHLSISHEKTYATAFAIAV